MAINMNQVNDAAKVAVVSNLFRTTELTIAEIADAAWVSNSTATEIIKRNFSTEERRERKRKIYANSKLGDKNPMTGKCGEHHHRYKGEVADGNGYIMILKPEWYTGRRGSKHVFQHTVVMCEHLGLTELPAGFVVHHIDEVKTNNDISNLALLTVAAHARLHALERATTIPQGSTQE